MTKELAKYEAAKHALAEARSVDEVKDIRSKSIALKTYAKQAKDMQLEADAHEIRMRAERRLGEMMAQQPKANGAREPGTKRGTTRDSEKPASLKEAGIDKNLADRSRKAAAMSDEKFEQEVEESRDRITTPPKKVQASVTEKRGTQSTASEIISPTFTAKGAVNQTRYAEAMRSVKQGLRSAYLLSDPATFFKHARHMLDDLERELVPVSASASDCRERVRA